MFINAGSSQGIRKGDILGAITGETGLSGELIGDITVLNNHTFVEVPKNYAQDILDSMKNTKIRGKTITVAYADETNRKMPYRGSFKKRRRR
jgi:ATP-dependent RNA helicase DeaD